MTLDEFIVFVRLSYPALQLLSEDEYDACDGNGYYWARLTEFHGNAALIIAGASPAQSNSARAASMILDTSPQLKEGVNVYLNLFGTNWMDLMAYDGENFTSTQSRHLAMPTDIKWIGIP